MNDKPYYPQFETMAAATNLTECRITHVDIRKHAQKHFPYWLSMCGNITWPRSHYFDCFEKYALHRGIRWEFEDRLWTKKSFSQKLSQQLTKQRRLHDDEEEEESEDYEDEEEDEEEEECDSDDEEEAKKAPKQSLSAHKKQSSPIRKKHSSPQKQSSPIRKKQSLSAHKKQSSPIRKKQSSQEAVELWDALMDLRKNTGNEKYIRPMFEKMKKKFLNHAAKMEY